MSGRDRRVVFAIVASSSAGAFAIATFSAIFPAISADFDLNIDNVGLGLKVPVVSSLLVVFLAGSLGDRLGQRRVAGIGGLVFCAGTLVVLAAPNLAAVIAGRTLEGLGAATLMIGAVAVTRSAFADQRVRAVVYGIQAATVPAVFFLAPTLAAVAARYASWRLVPAVLALIGGLATLAVWRFFPGEDREQEQGPRLELITPTLAGVTLAATAGAAVAFATSRTTALVLAGVAVVAGLALLVSLRKVSEPALDLSPLKIRGFPPALLAAAIPVAVNFFFFTSLLIEYHYDYGLVAAAAVMAPASLLSAGAGYLGGRLMARRGPALTAVLGLSIAVVAALLGLFVKEGSAAWFPLLVVCGYACGDTIAIAGLTANILNRVPGSLAGAGASLRKVATALGATAGAVLVGMVIFGAYERELSRSIDETVITRQDAEEAARQMRLGEGSEQLAEGLAAKYPQANEVIYLRVPALEEAEIVGYRTASGLAAIAYGLTIVLLLYSRRSLATEASGGRRPQVSSPL
jgi:DHA2 family multidrug resistance protein-like MFS transporter